MERILLHGIPYYIDKTNKLYTYQDQPLEIGTYQKDTDVITLKPIPDSLIRARDIWRSTLTAKPRKAVSAGTTEAGGEEGDGDEEGHSD